MPHQDATLGDAFQTLWHDLNVDPPIRALRIPLGGEQPPAEAGPGESPLWNLATVLDRYNDVEVTYPMAVDIRRAYVDGTQGETVESFFSAAGQRTAATRDALALAVVCGTERDPRSGGDSVLLNCGLDRPVRVSVPAGTAPAVGELRAVGLSRASEAAPWSARSMHDLARRPPRPYERRRAVVSSRPEFPWLRVTVDGADVYPDHDDEAASVLRMAWDPDVTRGLLAQHPLTRAQDAARPLGDPALQAVTLAYFDQELQGWLPVDRGLTELLGSVRGDMPLEMTYGGRVVDDRARVQWRLVAGPGFSYLLSAADWANAPDVADLLSGDPVALRLRVTVDRATGLLVLTEHADGRSGDDRNWRWSQVFAENADLMAWPDGAEMVTEADAPPGLPCRVPVDGLSPADTFFAVSKWGEYEQRQGRLLGVPLTSYALADWENLDLRRCARCGTSTPMTWCGWTSSCRSARKGCRPRSPRTASRSRWTRHRCPCCRCGRTPVSGLVSGGAAPVC